MVSTAAIFIGRGEIQRQNASFVLRISRAPRIILISNRRYGKPSNFGCASVGAKSIWHLTTISVYIKRSVIGMENFMSLRLPVRLSGQSTAEVERARQPNRISSGPNLFSCLFPIPFWRCSQQCFVFVSIPEFYKPSLILDKTYIR